MERKFTAAIAGILIFAGAYWLVPYSPSAGYGEYHGNAGVSARQATNTLDDSRAVRGLKRVLPYLRTPASLAR